MKTKYFVTARYTHEIEVEVTIPDEDDHDACAALAESAVRSKLPRYANLEDWRWRGSRPFSHRTRCYPVPEHCWHDLNGHRWACTGNFIVREDCPLPTHAEPRRWNNGEESEDGPWLKDIGDLGKVMRAATDRPHPGPFDRAFDPILAQGSVVVAEGFEKMGIVVRDGEPIAYIVQQ